MNLSRVIAAGVLALLVGGGVAAGSYTLVDVPPQSALRTVAPMQHGIAHVQVHDPRNVLSDSDEARMLHDAGSLDTVASVQQLHYIVFDKNHKNVNDSVEEYLRDQHPDLIGKDTFTDGVLIVGVGLDPRQAFVFAGEDVASQLDLHKGTHLDKSIDAIKPGVKDNNIPAGLFAGAREATDVEKLAQTRYEEARTDRAMVTGVSGSVAGGAMLIGAGAMAAAHRKREKRLAQAREDLAFVSREYGELAQRLDAIDIRANSLASPLAHQTLRSQWAEVRDRFLTIHNEVDAFGSLTTSSDPKALLAQADSISAAADTARKVSYAESNIDTLFKLEHGDTVVRQTEANELRSDIVAALASVTTADSGLYHALEAARGEADTLLHDATAPDFLERYARLLTDYQNCLTQLKEQHFSDVSDAKDAPVAPAVYDKDYRPGYGYHDFIPFWAVQSWHTDALAAQQSSSGSTNTSFSSGFSGAGGSSSF